jgi:hypothetical protein
MFACSLPEDSQPGWPIVSRESRPWTRWWWQGNALTEEGITAEMEAYRKAGIGGLEITPIYGVYGQEDQFADYLSPRFMTLLTHTLREAERLNLGIDMATGTGWPFGGPWIGDADACKNMEHTVYRLHGGERLKEKVRFTQEPYLRAIGSPMYGYNGAPDAGPRIDPKKIAIRDLAQPVSANPNLQDLALEQVKFERPLRLVTLMAYNEKGEPTDLTAKVGADGTLDWTAPPGEWRLDAVFEGWHGKMVERAGPGGEGNVIDHFSTDALHHYLGRFDSTFKSHDIKPLRAFFNDSYEVDDARGAADWTPQLFTEFLKRRGYDLRHHLPALFAQDTPEKNERILCDYRETVSELVLNNFTRPWKQWAEGHHKIIRNQAHGSPANILDLYGAVDIPEIEGEEPLRIKMATSAGHVMGKKLVSSESATWLNEHFESSLADIKQAVDRFLINGVNHVFYHGTCYSPPGEPWPGRLFYAAVHMNPRNPQWRDADALNGYIARAQSLLQRSQPDNDILLYFPIYDRFSAHGPKQLEHFDGVGKAFDSTSFKRAAEALLDRGYTFDFISDRQIANLAVDDSRLRTEGGSKYRTIIIPQCRYIPLATLEKIEALAAQGANMSFFEGLPDSFSGYDPDGSRQKKFQELISRLQQSQTDTDKIMVNASLEKLLERTGVAREPWGELGLQYIRKTTPEGQTEYFIANTNKKEYVGWIPLRQDVGWALWLDPYSGKIGAGPMRKNEKGELEIFAQLAPGQATFLRLYNKRVVAENFHWATPWDEPVPLQGTWSIEFTEGGPTLPVAMKTDTLGSWTDFAGQGYREFSGTASYTLTFNKPIHTTSAWRLDLGEVRESAEVFLNGKPLGTCIGPVYQLAVENSQLQDRNTLVIKVSNLMANRIADLDRRHIFWKKFYNVNFPARKEENRKDGLFSAAAWAPRPSGLLGPVILTPILRAGGQ